MTGRYVQRTIESELLAAAREFPVVILTGPRQTGKSTLLRHLFSDHAYLSLDDPFQVTLARQDPVRFLANLGPRAVIDEIQYAPGLLPYIKLAVDEGRRDTGAYVLTGSQFFPVMAGVTESLAGRAAVYELLGLSWEETGVPDRPDLPACFGRLFTGFFPDPLVHGVERNRYYASYLRTYLERDLRQILFVQDLTLFQSFIELLAARAGSILNLNAVAGECGVSFSTAKRWLSLLESTRIVYLLRPFHRNITKRVVKSPKLYFTDTGLLAYLQRYPDPVTLQHGPMAGAFFESMIVTEALKWRLNHNARVELFFFRDSNGNEIDLVLDAGPRCLLVETKLTATLRLEHVKTLVSQRGWFGNARGVLLSFAETTAAVADGVDCLPWPRLYDLLAESASTQEPQPPARGS